MSEVAGTEAEGLARHLAGAARASELELRLHGREPVRFRMHPLDVEAIQVGLFGEEAVGGTLLVWELPVVADEEIQLGMPVAEFEE